MDCVASSTSMPIRPAMLPDEWPEIYLVSLARANGVRRPRGQHVDSIRNVLPWEREATSGLAGGSTKRTSWSYVHGRPQYGPLPLPQWATIIRTVPLRYCPICLLEARYIRTRWRISGLSVCTLHGCFFRSNLAEAAITTGTRRYGEVLQLDSCGDAQLLEDAACCLPHELNVASMVWSPLEAMAQRSASPREDESLGTTASWTVLMWRLLELLSRVHHRQVIKAAIPPPITGISRVVRELSVSLTPSMDGMFTLFEALCENSHFHAARRFLDEVKRQEVRRPSGVSSLPLDALTDRLSRVGLRMLTRNRPGAMAFRELHERALSERAVAEELAPLGAGRVTVSQWLRRNVFKTAQLQVCGTKKYRFVDREKVREARRFLQSLTSGRDLAAEQGLDWPIFTSLRDAGLIGASVRGLPGYFRRSEVASLLGKLELVPAPVGDHTGRRCRLLCEEALRTAGGSLGFGAAVRAAISGCFAVYRDLSQPGLAAFSIGADGIAWMAEHRRSFFRTNQCMEDWMQPELFDA